MRLYKNYKNITGLLINWSHIKAFTLMTLCLTSCSSYNISAPITTIHRMSDINIFSNREKRSHLVKNSKKDPILYKRSYYKIPYGSYNNNTYTIKRGDTMYYVAWISGSNCRMLAKKNNITKPYNLYIGQTIQLNINYNNNLIIDKNKKHRILTQHSSSNVTITNINSSFNKYHSKNTGIRNINPIFPRSVSKKTITSSAINLNSSTKSLLGNNPSNIWKWITKGKIIDNFSSAEGGNKGLDIAGLRGQDILATANGRVVYAGNALSGYGNLIIIKHYNNYLSAYAHNETILVQEQQEVKAGQKIATMGSTGTSSVRLHFEIRYKGKPVNPLYYLPRR
ncbi:murein hydrolase activator NlpD [Candidatus Profftia sp. (ex Adelges kitamiensis)]|uniref:murein hydrolase activator NlpD n=1 Tax=Candidatus Profftia sp. (ex Adelges kitamiensis) TaxID=2864218 RepID=UPI001CE280BF|nr:murein hydrolase activator NlpD [Candidatus Profftia sp. (ex Adelges kitamiensis)]